MSVFVFVYTSWPPSLLWFLFLSLYEQQWGIRLLWRFQLLRWFKVLLSCSSIISFMAISLFERYYKSVQCISTGLWFVIYCKFVSPPMLYHISRIHICKYYYIHVLTVNRRLVTTQLCVLSLWEEAGATTYVHYPDHNLNTGNFRRTN